MAERKLASVQYVHHIVPIDGADRIECVQVLGWNVVAKKGDFKVGDSCVYFEVDSYLPVCEKFEFLRSSCYKNDAYMGEGFRLKTQRFRGQISQGLVLPLDILPQDREYALEQDVTDLLGVRKWEIEDKVSSSGTIVGEMPYGIPKTDEMRVQSFPELIGEFAKASSYYISTKMDGTSVTMYWKEGRFGVCGRNYEYADDGKCAFWEYAKAHQIEEKLRTNSVPDIAIQGEFCGGGIQKNRLKLKHPEWYVFTIIELIGSCPCSDDKKPAQQANSDYRVREAVPIIDMDTHRRMGLEEMEKLCGILGLQHVPIEEKGTQFPYTSVEELLERARGKYASGMNKEGIVIRPIEPEFSYTLSGPLSMKVLNNDYLLKE